MTDQQLKMSLDKKRLSLNTKSFFRHYEAPFWCIVFSLLGLGYFIYLQITEPVKITIAMVGFLLIFPALTFIVWLNQYRILRFRETSTSLDVETTYRVAKFTLETLQWPVYVERENKFLQAVNPFSDLRTWGDEMITIVIGKKRILVNSICNLDRGKMAQAGFSFGKNRQNVRKFIEMFDLLSRYPEKAKFAFKPSNDKIVIVEKAGYSDLKKVLAAFCELYPERKYETRIALVRLPGNAFAILFLFNIEFEILCFLVNYIKYPIEFNWNVDVKGWTTANQNDTWINREIAGKQVMLFVPDDEERDQIFLTTADGVGYKINLQVNRGRKLLSAPMLQYIPPSFTVEELKDHTIEEITE